MLIILSVLNSDHPVIILYDIIGYYTCYIDKHITCSRFLRNQSNQAYIYRILRRTRPADMHIAHLSCTEAALILLGRNCMVCMLPPSLFGNGVSYSVHSSLHPCCSCMPRRGHHGLFVGKASDQRHTSLRAHYNRMLKLKYYMHQNKI